MLFEAFCKEVSIALESSCIMDYENPDVMLHLNDETVTRKGIPFKVGELSVNSHAIATVFVTSMAKPNMQFYDELIHCSVHSFDVLDIDDNTVFYMQGNWIYGNIATQLPLCKYIPGSNFEDVVEVYYEWQEKKHKEAYDNEIEED